MAAAAVFLFAIAVLRAWWSFGRDLVNGRQLLAVPWYVLSKLPIYLRFLVRRQRAWVRTDRDSAELSGR